MTDDTYTASFLGDDGQEARTEQLESIGGQPQKSLVRPAADGGDAVSAEAVKSAIRALIAGEGATILSDDTLVEQLNAKGFDIARRTVAKYREAMGIGSSIQRRRQRAIAGKAA